MGKYSKDGYDVMPEARVILLGIVILLMGGILAGIAYVLWAISR